MLFCYAVLLYYYCIFSLLCCFILLLYSIMLLWYGSVFVYKKTRIKIKKLTCTEVKLVKQCARVEFA